MEKDKNPLDEFCVKEKQEKIEERKNIIESFYTLE